MLAAAASTGTPRVGAGAASTWTWKLQYHGIAGRVAAGCAASTDGAAASIADIVDRAAAGFAASTADRAACSWFCCLPALLTGLLSVGSAASTADRAADGCATSMGGLSTSAAILRSLLLLELPPPMTEL